MGIPRGIQKNVRDEMHAQTRYSNALTARSLSRGGPHRPGGIGWCGGAGCRCDGKVVQEALPVGAVVGAEVGASVTAPMGASVGFRQLSLL